MRITSSVITAAFLLLTGCVGDVDDINNPPPGTDGGTTTAKKGKENYIANVHPIVMRCSGAGCHSQAAVTGMYGFAVTDAGASYEEVIKLPTLIGTYTEASAAIFTKIAAGPPGNHVLGRGQDEDQHVVHAGARGSQHRRRRHASSSVDRCDRQVA